MQKFNVFLSVVLAVIILSFGIRAWATTVTTTDGQNFSVSNDQNPPTTRVLTMGQITTQITISNQALQQDGIRDLKDGETLTDWQYVQLQAQAAQQAWQANQTNGT